MKKGLVKVLIDVVVILAILLVVDVFVGWAGERYTKWLNEVPRDGDAALINYNLNAAMPDIAIVGNSTAICHYVPYVIHDSILSFTGKDLSVFNMGMSRQRMSYNYYALRCLEDRKLPQMVIANVWSTYLSAGEETTEFVEFRPYTRVNQNIREMLENHGEYSFFMSSNMFCYNTEIIKLLLSPMKQKYADGFQTSKKKLKIFEKNDVIEDKTPLSPISVKEFDAMIELAKKNDIVLVVVLSPTLSIPSDTLSQSYRYMKDKCKKEDVFFLDYTHDEQFYRADYFRDITHMNYYGAMEFSRNLMRDLKTVIIERFN